jgi:hypothetical protein
MKFTAALALLVCIVSVSAKTCDAYGDCVTKKRSLNLTNKPREWINAARAAAVEAPINVNVPVEAKE